MSNHEHSSAADTLRAAAYAFSPGQIYRTACELDIPDAVASGAATTEAVAAVTATDRDALARLLRALEAFGVLEVRDGEWALTEQGELLRRGVDGSFRDRFLFFHGPGVVEPWMRLGECVRTGNTAWPSLGFDDAWAYWTGERAEVFHGAMGEVSAETAPLVAEECRLDGVERIVDVGGGNGSLLAALLRRHPSAFGVVFDTHTGVRGADHVLAAAGVGQRCEVVAGDFFDSVPEGDAYLLKSILHDWQDPEATRILTTVRTAMPGDGVVLIVEQVLDGSRSSVLGDVNMLVAGGGRERTRDEYATLLAQAGLVLVEVRECAGTTFCVLEARREQGRGDGHGGEGGGSGV